VKEIVSRARLSNIRNCLRRRATAVIQRRSMTMRNAWVA
jgi:hypothetical protein